MYPERLEEIMDEYSYLNESINQYEKLNDHDRFLINLYCSNYNPRKYISTVSPIGSPLGSRRLNIKQKQVCHVFVFSLGGTSLTYYKRYYKIFLIIGITAYQPKTSNNRYSFNLYDLFKSEDFDFGVISVNIFQTNFLLI